MSHQARKPGLCVLISAIAGNRRWCPRAPLRVAYEMRWIDAGRSNVTGPSSSGRRSTDKLAADLAVLEQEGAIVRHRGYIEIRNRTILRTIGQRAA